MPDIKGIETQIQSEYQEGFDYINKKKRRQVQQLILMNNLERGDENTASTMLFSFFNRVFSNLYDDKMQVKFMPGEDSDYKKVEALNKTAVHDYQEMDKSLLDYDWVWDACFFGRGYAETLVFDRERKLMLPSVINPLMLIYDPYFASIQDWRYYGKWILKSGHEINRLIKLGIITGIKDAKEIPSGIEQNIWDYKSQRDKAKTAIAATDDSASPNKLYQLMDWYTYDENGNKTNYWLDKNLSKILKTKKLDLKDGRKGESKWPLVAKEVFREPHSSVPISVPDIVEDKHRALNVLYNLAFVSAKDEATPIYAYDITILKDSTQLIQRQVNQHIQVEGDPNAAIMPIKKNPTLSTSLIQFMGLLRSESAEAIGTAEITQKPGQKKGKQGATEAALLQQIADLVQSLQSKLMAQGEKEFWSHWYQRYHRFAKKGDQKLISVASADGITFENIEIADMMTKYPPKVIVSSAKEAQFKEFMERRDLQAQLGVLAKMMDPKGFKDFMKHIYLPKFDTIDTASIDRIFPKSLDEIKAEQENEMIEKDKLPTIDSQDDDTDHLYVHQRAKNTSAKWAHIFSHEDQLAEKRAKAEAIKAGGGQGAPTPESSPPGQPGGKTGVSQPNPVEASAPMVEPMSKSMAPQKLKVA